MKILGLQKLTLLDYPGRIGAIVFLGGCNFRCPFCQNSALVLTPESLPSIDMDEFTGFLHKRAGILEGICVTGGEPTLHRDLPKLFAQIRSAGYLAKLDTNGTNPDMLASLLEQDLLDYVAMDIKSSPARYVQVCGLPKQTCETEKLLTNVKRSVDILKNSSVEYEFRTTVVKGLHQEEDFEKIACWLSGCKNYYLQSFRDCPEVLTENHTFSAFSKEEMEHFLGLVRKKIPQACLRGI